MRWSTGSGSSRWLDPLRHALGPVLENYPVPPGPDRRAERADAVRPRSERHVDVAARRVAVGADRVGAVDQILGGRRIDAGRWTVRVTASPKPPSSRVPIETAESNRDIGGNARQRLVLPGGNCADEAGGIACGKQLFGIVARAVAAQFGGVASVIARSLPAIVARPSRPPVAWAWAV
jgi:hypothetical protein